MIVTCVASDWKYLPQTTNQYPQEGNLLSVGGSMIDAGMNAAVFAALVLYIVGFSAWAHKRVP
jgi:hypothetical protein